LCLLRCSTISRLPGASIARTQCPARPISRFTSFVRHESPWAGFGPSLSTTSERDRLCCRHFIARPSAHRLRCERATSANDGSPVLGCLMPSAPARRSHPDARDIVQAIQAIDSRGDARAVGRPSRTIPRQRAPSPRDAALFGPEVESLVVGSKPPDANFWARPLHSVGAGWRAVAAHQPPGPTHGCVSASDIDPFLGSNPVSIRSLDVP
jgi:hypothetical protein